LALSRPECAAISRIFGEYEIVSGFVITISRDGDKFWALFPGQPRKESFAESNTAFFIKAEEIGLTFVKDASGALTHLVLNRIGSQLKAKKIK
jgi:hypothetical protein